MPFRLTARPIEIKAGYATLWRDFVLFIGSAAVEDCRFLLRDCFQHDDGRVTPVPNLRMMALKQRAFQRIRSGFGPQRPAVFGHLCSYLHSGAECYISQLCNSSLNRGEWSFCDPYRFALLSIRGQASGDDRNPFHSYHLVLFL